MIYFARPTPNLDFRVKTLDSVNELKTLRESMLRQRQWYPNFDSWVDEKCIPRIESGDYIPFLFSSSTVLNGALIYRWLEENEVEIKYLRIDKKYHNQYWGKVLLRQLELATGNVEFITDVTKKNEPALNFFLRYGFKIISEEQLYKEGQTECILSYKY